MRTTMKWSSCCPTSGRVFLLRSIWVVVFDGTPQHEVARAARRRAVGQCQLYVIDMV